MSRKKDLIARYVSISRVHWTMYFISVIPLIYIPISLLYIETYVNNPLNFEMGLQTLIVEYAPLLFVFVLAISVLYFAFTLVEHDGDLWVFNDRVVLSNRSFLQFRSSEEVMRFDSIYRIEFWTPPGEETKTRRIIRLSGKPKTNVRSHGTQQYLPAFISMVELSAKQKGNSLKLDGFQYNRGLTGIRCLIKTICSYYGIHCTELKRSDLPKGPPRSIEEKYNRAVKSYTSHNRARLYFNVLLGVIPLFMILSLFIFSPYVPHAFACFYLTVIMVGYSIFLFTHESYQDRLKLEMNKDFKSLSNLENEKTA